MLVVEDPEDLDEPRDVENLLDLRVRAHEIDRAAVLADPLEAADEDAQARRIDVPHLFEIDDQVVVTLIDELGDRVFDFRRGVNVDLAAEFDDVCVGVRLADVHFDIQGVSYFTSSGAVFDPAWTEMDNGPCRL